ncbi:MAG: hypothetical protein KAT62_15340 [Desulfuromonadales bacterium]|nr:hypothetical protein [Chloroflexota bacterium]MCK4623573.1 hypothetical protein [Desulfuromonadales bacterium]
MEHYLGVAGEQGISEEEIGATQGICMAVCAGRVNALMKEIARKNS